MTGLRLSLALLLSVLLAVPVTLPVWVALGASVPSSAGEFGRIAELAGSTLALAGGAGLIAVPVGVLLAVLIERTRIPGHCALRGLVAVGLFVPLPVYAVAWQVVLSAWLPPLTLEPGQVAWRPWSQGLLPAAWVHGMASLPWVVWIVSAGLRTADRGLEEEAIVRGGPMAVIRWVLVPRAVLAALAASGWVVAQSATEIPVTDAMMVRTFAEEVYTQLVSSSEGWVGAVVVTVPAWIAVAVVGGWVLYLSGPALAAVPTEASQSLGLQLRPLASSLTGFGVWAVVSLFAGLPLAALIGKAGGAGTQAGWSPEYLLAELGKVVRTDGPILFTSLGSAVAVGLSVTALAWTAGWLAVGSRRFGRFLFLLCVTVAFTPGPIVGRGLKLTIDQLLAGEEQVLQRLDLQPTFPPLRSALYDQPSPLPAGWAVMIRFFPIGVAILWPAVRAIPRDQLELARLDGLGIIGTWRRVVIPLTAPAGGRAVVAVAALALGEVSAAKLVNPPFRPQYSLRLFDQMHYGADSTVAALCLLQLIATVGLTIGGAWLVTPRTARSR